MSQPDRQTQFDEDGVYHGPEYDVRAKAWDDPRVCQRCVRTNGSYSPSFAYVIMNVRSGKYHSGDYGRTDCGRDATTNQWVWPL